MNNIAILPTGDEIRDGTVLDADSPEIMAWLLRLFPRAAIHRDSPIPDRQTAIAAAVERWANRADLIVLIGGSGGGHRHDVTMTRDFTHSALDEILEEPVSREIYGKNGHMWSKLVCGRKGSALVFNVPGPYVEASAAIRAFCEAYGRDPADLSRINSAMAEAVIAQYG